MIRDILILDEVCECTEIKIWKMMDKMRGIFVLFYMDIRCWRGTRLFLDHPRGLATKLAETRVMGNQTPVHIHHLRQSRAYLVASANNEQTWEERIYECAWLPTLSACTEPTLEAPRPYKQSPLRESCSSIHPLPLPDTTMSFYRRSKINCQPLTHAALVQTEHLKDNCTALYLCFHTHHHVLMFCCRP